MTSPNRTSPLRRSTSALDVYERSRRQVFGQRGGLSADAATAAAQQVEALGVDGARRWALDYLSELGGVVPDDLIVMLARVPGYSEQLVDAEDDNARGRLLGIINLTVSRVVGLLTSAQ